MTTRPCIQEFNDLLRTLIGERNLPEGVIEELWAAADGATHGHIDAATLSHLLTEKRQHKGFRLMSTCPITGRALDPDDDFANIVYMTLALDGGLSSNLQGGYRTAAQARFWLSIFFFVFQHVDCLLLVSLSGVDGH